MQENIAAAPTLVYPESDGKPMAETPKHQQVITFLIENASINELFVA
ncbi:MAG: hypothetical protein OXG97_13075 [Candidatus Poribacteria bacterium]|nr:hypothetical protein [Candidatus Poribacteria bacterium]